MELPVSNTSKSNGTVRTEQNKLETRVESRILLSTKGVFISINKVFSGE